MPPTISKDAAAGSSVLLESPSFRHAEDFVAAVRRSRSLHRGLVKPPQSMEAFRVYAARFRRPTHIGHLLTLPEGELVGVANISEIVRGVFQSAYLGYYAFMPFAGRGYMKQGLRLVLAQAFRTYRLHRLEANIQPGNSRSIELVKRLGFHLEGLSPRYLKIAGRWCDHQRWAITAEDWRPRQ